MPLPAPDQQPTLRYCYCGCGETLRAEDLRFLRGHKPKGKAGDRDPEAGARAAARHRERHPQASQAYRRKWVDANPDHNAKAIRRYREAPVAKAKKRDRMAVWNSANGDLVRKYARDYQRRRDALTLDRESTEAYAEIVERDPCSYCGSPGGTVDHIHPISKGGLHDASNLTAACHSCNSKKWTRPLLLFLSGQSPLT